jgi:hypothetical protein
VLNILISKNYGIRKTVFFSFNPKCFQTGCQWLTLGILATQEVEIKRIVVQSQPQANSLRDSTSKIPNTKMGWYSVSSGRMPA